ncbi:hypothetical protein FA95DRAFT_244967 [Auriscalpium vulgare]|uniref:Uncharacterized protein n=1 Tax=Auriscalpium vulgare TaxID=40419 RepID=A0ACB8RLN1_9AGAM|nr:hypothetical protein FA95DRAFT_244967 [Auriscalpium vulgare]
MRKKVTKGKKRGPGGVAAPSATTRVTRSASNKKPSRNSAGKGTVNESSGHRMLTRAAKKNIRVPPVAPELPLEMWSAILDNNDTDDPSDFRAYRLINKTACAAATPRAFSLVTVIGTRASAEHFRDLVKRADLARHVRVLGCRNAHCFKRPLYPDWTPLDHDAWEPLVEAFALLSALTSLHTLLIAFDPSESDTKLQPALLEAMARAYAHATPPIRSLTLEHLAPVSHEFYELPGFRNILQTLSELRLGVGHVADEDQCSKTQWERTLEHSILGVAAKSLQTLKLFNAYTPDTDVLGRMTFPALTSMEEQNTGVDMIDFTGRHLVHGRSHGHGTTRYYHKGQRGAIACGSHMTAIALPYPRCLDGYS